MNIKGLKINILLARRILKSKNTLSIEDYKGLDTIGRFSWSGFALDEFQALIQLLVQLYDAGSFGNINEEHLFVLNFSTDVTEMDIVTVVNYKKKPLFIDVELKKGENNDDLKQSLYEQIMKRRQDHLPQLIKEDNYLLLGFINFNFIEGNLYYEKENFNYRH